MNRFKKLRTQRKISQTELASALNVHQTAVSQWELGKAYPDIGTIKQLSDFYEVSTDYLLEKTDMIRCQECDFEYDSEDAEQVALHADRHQKLKRAIDKFGFCWTHSQRECRHEARSIMNDETRTIFERRNAAIEIIKAYFSRSLQNCDYDLAHEPFSEYIQYYLAAHEYEIPKPIFNQLVAEYGRKAGLKSGATTLPPVRRAPAKPSDDRLIASYGEVKEQLSEDDIDDIELFIRMKAERKKKRESERE